MIFYLRPSRKILKATTSKIKKACASKRQRDRDDSNDDDYSPNPSEMAVAFSIAGVADTSEEEVESDEDEVIDLLGLNLPSRQWIAESYSNAIFVNQFQIPPDTNVL